MTCRKVTEFLADYLDGALPLHQRLIFKTHLLLCRDCRGYLRSYAETLKLTRSLAEEAHQQAADIPSELMDAVMTTLRKSVNE